MDLILEPMVAKSGLPRRLCVSAMAVIAVLFPAIDFAQQQPAGTILYTRVPDGAPPWPVEDISLVSLDGANVKALTNDGHSHDGTWSPDGRRVLFIHDSALQTKPAYKEQAGYESYHPVELSVMDRDGGNRHLLRRIEPVIYGAAWSPDGKTIAVSCKSTKDVNRARPADEPMRSGLFLLSASGQGGLKLLFRDALTPAWSPDGQRLAFSVERPRGHWSVHVANSDGSHDAQLTDPILISGSPAWSPDGRFIAYDQFGGQQIFVMNADGSHPRQITKDAGWSCGHPTWSNDGKRLVFSCRSASMPCGGGISSVGTVLPECTRRLFSVSPFDVNSKPIQLNQSDSILPAFAPR